MDNQLLLSHSATLSLYILFQLMNININSKCSILFPIIPILSTEQHPILAPTVKITQNWTASTADISLSQDTTLRSEDLNLCFLFPTPLSSPTQRQLSLTICKKLQNQISISSCFQCTKPQRLGEDRQSIRFKTTRAYGGVGLRKYSQFY